MATDTYISTQTTTSDFTLPTTHRISWGAIFAGVSLLFALSWLLLLLGSAIGVGIADATDLGAIGDGLGIGATIWILLSTLIATLAAGMLAAKLSGTVDDRIGALHGLTVWSVGTLCAVLLGAAGIGGTVNAISGAISSASKVSSTAVIGASGSEGSSMIPETISTSIAAIMKRQAANTISQTASGQNSPDSSDVRSAINTLNAEDAGAITSALIAGNNDKARDELTQRTDLSEAEVEAIINGAEQKVADWSNSDDAQDAQAWLNDQYLAAKRSVSRSVSDMAGDQVNAQEINQALQQLNSETVMQAGRYLVMGNPDMAKDVLAINTNLSEADIEAIVDGAEKEAQQFIDEAKAELNEATEAVATYMQAMLWAAFIAAALGMTAGLVGGHMGAGAVRRVYVVRQ